VGDRRREALPRGADQTLDLAYGMLRKPAMEKEWSALVVDDDTGVRQSIRLCLEPGRVRVLGVGTPAGALEALGRSRFDVVYLDLWLGSDSGLTLLPELLRQQPGIGVVVITAFATFETAVEAMRLGAVDYLPKPFTPDQVRRSAQRVLAANALRAEQVGLRERIDATLGEEFFESSSPSYRAFLELAGRVAGSDSVALLCGESGTGKNILARWIHQSSKRSRAPFVVVHCPDLAGDLLTSALFGHRKGAFTGAVADAPGKVDAAAGGTLLLDEVGELSLDAQARLLRFLNDHTYERLGEPRERQANVRILAATNRSLAAEVKAGRFREDLFFRLNVITLTLPPLRERPEDILPLALHYLRFCERSHGRTGLVLTPQAERAIADSPWPGNLRELRNAIQRAVILTPGLQIGPTDLGLPNPASGQKESTAAAVHARPVLPGENVSLDDLEREHIARIVARSPSLETAARVLGIDPTTLQRKRKRYGLS
jgi:NtrC-family two-component system response regulator AlgB